MAARHNYLVIDKVDFNFSAKEAARAMSVSPKKHWQLLNKKWEIFYWDTKIDHQVPMAERHAEPAEA